MNGEFSHTVKNTIAKRASERCTLCNIATSKPNTGNAQKFISIGEAAHIRGARPTSNNRYDETMRDEERSDIANAIWLCRICHKKVDSDATTYTVQFLTDKKRSHEENITLGHYDIQWQDYIQLKEKIQDLTAIISEKEQNQALRSQISDAEITALRLELERSQSEKLEIERNYELLKTTAAGFATDVPDQDIQDILENIERGEFDLAKRKLDIVKLKDEEQTLARKYLLKANLEQIERHFDDAEASYLRATQISDIDEFFDAYISYLMQVGKGETALMICLKKLDQASDIDSKIRLHTALAEISATLHDHEQVIQSLEEAKELLTSLEPLSVDDSIVLATVLTGLGVAYKNLGDYDQALLIFQDAINIFWRATSHHGLVPAKELGDLQVNVAGIYLVNNDPQTALQHFSAAEAAYKESNSYMQMLIVGLNAVEAYTHHKIQNFDKARTLIDKVLKECKESYATQPLTYLKYYAGALQKSAILYSMSGDITRAEDEISCAIHLYEDVFQALGIIDDTVLISLYSNFAKIQRQKGAFDISASFLRKAIDLASTLPDAVHEKHLDLAVSYAMLSELLTDKAEVRQTLQTALDHILKCNVDRVLMARVWKVRIEGQLALLTNAKET